MITFLICILVLVLAFSLALACYIVRALFKDPDYNAPELYQEAYDGSIFELIKDRDLNYYERFLFFITVIFIRIRFYFHKHYYPEDFL